MPGGSSPPPSVYLSWPAPNYIDPHQRSDAVIILGFTLLALCFIVIGLRLYARYLQSKNFDLDDGIIVLNLLPLTGFVISIYLGYKNYGFNRHIWDIPPEDLRSGRKLTLALESLYTLSAGMTKIAVLLFYRRLTSGSLSPRFQFAVYLALASVVTYTIAGITAVLTTRTPLAAYWNLISPDWRLSHAGQYHCINESALITASAVISTVQDFVACAMPMILFYRLKISRRQKVMLTLIFSLAYMLCICAIVRVVFTIRLYQTTYDISWESQPGWIVTMLEIHLGIICASAPALNYFFRHALRNPTFPSQFRISRSTENATRTHHVTNAKLSSESKSHVLQHDQFADNNTVYVMDDLELEDAG